MPVASRSAGYSGAPARRRCDSSRLRFSEWTRSERLRSLRPMLTNQRMAGCEAARACLEIPWRCTCGFQMEPLPVQDGDSRTLRAFPRCGNHLSRPAHGFFGILTGRSRRERPTVSPSVLTARRGGLHSLRIPFSSVNSNAGGLMDIAWPKGTSNGRPAPARITAKGATSRLMGLLLLGRNSSVRTDVPRPTLDSAILSCT